MTSFPRRCASPHAPTCTRTALFALVALLFGAFGCGGEKGAEATGNAEASAESLDLELLHEIGSLDDVDESLTMVLGGLLLPAGDLLIPQTEDAEIRRYDAKGALVGTIGRRGEGPGEFGAVRKVGLVGDTLWVHDTRNARMHRFELDGTLISSTSWPTTIEQRGDVILVWGMTGTTLRADGSALAMPGISVRRGGRTGALESMPIGVFLPDGEPPADTVVEVTPPPFTSPAPPEWRPAVQTNALSGVFRGGEAAFVIDRWSEELPDVPSFRVFAVSVEGDTLFDRSFEYSPVPADAGAIRAAYLAGLGEESRERARGRVWVPELLPAVTSVVATSEGVLWLAREDHAKQRTWWGLDQASGELVATLQLPTGERILDHRGDAIVTTFTDEFDVAYVRRYRIVR